MPPGVSGRDVGLVGTARGPGGALVARGGNLPRDSAVPGRWGLVLPRPARHCQKSATYHIYHNVKLLGKGAFRECVPRASGGMPRDVDGRFGLSFPMP